MHCGVIGKCAHEIERRACASQTSPAHAARQVDTVLCTARRVQGDRNIEHIILLLASLSVMTLSLVHLGTFQSLPQARVLNEPPDVALQRFVVRSVV